MTYHQTFGDILAMIGPGFFWTLPGLAFGIGWPFVLDWDRSRKGRFAR